MKIAILEDNPRIGDVLKLSLESVGHDAYPFDKTKDFLDFLAASSDVALIIVDYYLKTEHELSGADVIRKVRGMFPEMPAILISAAPRFVLLKAMEGLPNVQIKEKPFKTSDLAKTIEMLANR